MSGDKRSVSTDALETLGTIIDETQKRDAIHLAVIPMVAAAKLFPGQDVGVGPDGAGPSAEPRGIVDPFLKAPVQPGERFWLVIYPRQITSLRHVWTHPAFPEEGLAFHAEADDHYVSSEKATSERWLKAFAEDIGLSYQKALEAMKDVEQYDGDGICFNYDTPDRCWTDLEEMWRHYEVVTGRKVTDSSRGVFRCAC